MNNNERTELTNNNKDYKDNETGRNVHLLPKSVATLFYQAQEIVNKEGILTDNILIALYGAFGVALEKALRLIDKKSVTLIKLQDLEHIYMIQVKGTTGQLYFLFPRINFCTCIAYRQTVVGSRRFLSCKHVIAGRLAEILGPTTYQTTISNREEFNKLLHFNYKEIHSADALEL